MTHRSPISRGSLRPAARLAAALAALAAALPSAARADGRVVYGNAATTPQQRAYGASSNTFAAASAAGAAAAANPTQVVDRASPTRVEHVAGYVTTGGILYVLRWNGTTWSNEWNVTVGGAGANGRRFDIAYEATSGRAIVLYSRNVATTNEMGYRIWNGTAWTAEATLDTARLTGTVNWIKLAARRAAGSNALSAAFADTLGDLSAFAWNGTAWSSEPGAALSTTLQQSTVAGDKDAFDVAVENASGDTIVVYSETTPTNRYATLVGATWTTAQTLSATGRTIFSMFAAADPDPASNQVVIGWDRSASANRYAVIWDGATLGTIATVGTNANATNPPASSHQMQGVWLRSGTAKRAVVVYQSTTFTQIDYGSYDPASVAWTTGQAATGFTTGEKRWVSFDADPNAPGTAMLTYSDANSDLWAKRLEFDGTNLTWANADGGTALTATLTNATAPGFSFAYDRVVGSLDLATGASEPPSATVTLGQAAPLDAFTLAAQTGIANVASVTVTVGGTPAAAARLSIQDTSACNMATPYGELTSGIVLGDNPIPTTGLAVGTAPAALWVCMTAGSVASAQTVTGVVASASAPGYFLTGSDARTATVTVSPPPNLILATGTDTDGPDVTLDGIARLDGFTLAAQSGTASVATITLNLTNPAALKNVFVSDSSVCTGGTNFGTATPGGTPFVLPVSGLSVGTTPVALYVCGTGAQVGASTAVTPVTVASAAAPGYGFSGTDTNTTIVVNVLPPPNVAIATGTDPAGTTSVTVDGVAKLDGFTLTASTGTATVSSITVSLTNPSALKRVFVMSGTACTGGTEHATATSPGATAILSTTGLSVSTTPVALSLCGVGALVAATTAVTPATATATAAPGYVQGTAGDTSTGYTVNVTAPANNLTIATGASSPANAAVTYAYPPPVAPVDLFTLAAPAAGTAVTSITASVTSSVAGAVKNVFISSSSTCTGGTTYGAAGGTGGTIPISGLTVGTAATTLYVCVTAGMASSVATVNAGTVTAASAVGHGSTGSSTSTTVVTVNPPAAAPTVSIVAPAMGKVVSAAGAGYQYKVQVRVHLGTGIPGTAPNNITAVSLSTDGGATFPIAMTQNANYNSGSPTVIATLYEATISNPAVAAGVVLRARVTTGAVTATSEPVTISVAAGGTGDGHLTVRDNAAQLCQDCHALQTHSSEGTGLQYGAWAVQCRDCHTPHSSRNIFLVRESITPPSLGGATPPARQVGFVKRTGDSGTAGWDVANARPTATGSYANTDYTGPCQVCHTRTAAPSGETRFRNSGTTDNHFTGAGTMRCSSCHRHTAGFKGGDCTACHSTTQPITVGPLAGTGSRRAVVLEFANAWSHKRSAGGTVTKFDCIACHMEGDRTTGGPSSAHANGYVELRDPDTGANIKGVTFSGGTGADPGAYASTAADVRFPRFSRDLGSSTLEPEVQAIMINLCLKCHDSNGATASFVPGGSPEKPFGTTIAGAGYTGAGVTAGGVTGGVTDVNAAFATTNSSYHPIRGKQNNWYAKLTRMVAPWNTATRGATADATSWGPLLSCWDCHALPTDAGVITATVTAHGATATLRGNATASGTAPTATTGATLCWKCHAGYNGANPTHAAGSAMNTNADGGMTPFMQYGCNRCHGSDYTTAVVRPVRAQDVHGVNALPALGTKSGRWLTDPRPYAFIRNTRSLGNHQPAQIGATAYAPTCVHLNDSPCSSRTETYTPGGTF